MEETTFAADPMRLMIAAAVGIVVLLVLIIKFKLHPVLSMMISAIIIGAGAGMPLTMISDTVEKGVGKTLQGIALLVRASVGSSIVAMTMASGIMATMPAVMGTSMIYRAAMCCAICGGATALSHVNDAGFWLVTSFLEIDEKTTLKSWTIMETLIGVTALIVSFEKTIGTRLGEPGIYDLDF